MSNIDNFLASISQEVNIDQNEKINESKNVKTTKPKSKKKKVDEEISFDTNGLFGENNYDNPLPVWSTITENNEIINETVVTTNESVIENDNVVGVDIKTIREVIREELDDYFKQKMVLEESSAGNAQVIFLKVGNSLFKGNMEFVKSV
jgi:hypothetical protein